MRYEEIARPTDCMENQGKFSLNMIFLLGLRSVFAKQRVRKGIPSIEKNVCKSPATQRYIACSENTSSVKASLINVH